MVHLTKYLLLPPHLHLSQLLITALLSVDYGFCTFVDILLFALCWPEVSARSAVES